MNKSDRLYHAKEGSSDSRFGPVSVYPEKPPNEAIVFGVGLFNSAVHGNPAVSEGRFDASVLDLFCPHEDNQTAIRSQYLC